MTPRLRTTWRTSWRPRTHCVKPIAHRALLVGHSRGGSAALAAAEQIPETVGVATIGAPFDQKNCSAEQIGSMKKALVVFHSPQDTVVGDR